MKQQQWTITNYGALILGAIYAVKLPPEPGLPHHQTYLKGLAIATAVVGSLLLLRIQSDMAKSRWDFTVPLIAVLAVGAILVYFAL